MVVHEECFQVTAVLSEGRGLAGDGDHVVGRVETRLDESIFHKCFVGQRLERGAGFRDEDEEGMSHIDGVQHVHRIVGIDVADEAGFHLQGTFGASPVLKCQVHSPWAQIASTDADLHDGRERLTSCVGYLAVMHFSSEVGDSFLLFDVERTLVDSVRNNRIAQLSSGQVMQNQALFAGVDHGAVVQLGELISQLRFGRQAGQLLQKLIVHLFGTVVVRKPACHGQGVVPHPLRAFLACQSRTQVNARGIGHEFPI